MRATTGHAGSPQDDTTVCLPRGARQAAAPEGVTVLVSSAVLAPAPTAAADAGESPVFVDDSGGRKRLMRLLGVLVALLSISFLAIVGVALAVPSVATSVGLGDVVPFIVPGAAAPPPPKAPVAPVVPAVAKPRPKPRPVVVATTKPKPVDVTPTATHPAPTTAPTTTTTTPTTTTATTPTTTTAPTTTVTTAAPVTQAPVTQAPVTQAPVTFVGVTHGPVTLSPHKPVVILPVDLHKPVAVADPAP